MIKIAIGKKGALSSREAMQNDNPLDAIAETHRVHERICDCLEAIADGLPDDVDCRMASSLAVSLRYELPLHHRDEDEGLFPLLEKRADPGDNVTVILRRLTAEHANDEGFAEELDEVLDALGRGERVDNPDMVGYMLRGFFEIYRRHLHWEDTLVLPLARLRLNEDDLVVLKEAFARHRAEFSREMRNDRTLGASRANSSGGSDTLPH